MPQPDDLPEDAHPLSTQTGGGPLTVDTLQTLSGPTGEPLLAAAETLAAELEPWQVQERLRSQASGELVRAAVALQQARRAAQGKFGELATRLYLDDAGVQMASATAVAAHRAGRFPTDAVIADLTCGVGGDVLALASRGPVAALDLDPARAVMAGLNAGAAGLRHRVVVGRGDALAPAVRCDALFVDPARRTEAGRRVRRAADYAPPLSTVPTWRRLASLLAVKTSPALDESERPAGADETEFVSWRGQCREAVSWFGVADAARRRATVIGAGSLTWEQDTDPEALVAPPGEYLFDPDPAVVRSHLVGLLAQRIDAWLVAPRVAYLSAARPVSTPFARCFRVLRRVPYGRRLRPELVGEGWRPVEVLRRRFPVEPAVLSRQLQGVGDAASRQVSLVCTRFGDRPVVFICEPCDQ